MIKDFYSKEIENMVAMTNYNAFAFNLSLKIKKDLNIMNFLNNLFENTKNYDINSCSCENYDFENNVKEINDLLMLFLKSLKSDSYIKSQSSKDMIKACKVFPDYGGRTIIKLLSFLPLINLLSKKIRYKNYILENPKLIDNNYGINLDIIRKEEVLEIEVSKKIKKILPDEEFVNYKLKSEYINNFEKYYNEDIKENLDNFINNLIELYKNSENNKDLLIIGKVIWDNDFNKVLSNEEYFFSKYKEIKEEILNNEKLAIDFVEPKIKKHINRIINDNLESLEILNDNFLYNIILNLKNDLTEVEIKEICKFYIVNKDISLTNLELESKMNNKIIIKCIIDF